MRGWETDVSYVVNDAVTLGSSFGRVDSKYTCFGSRAPQVIDRSDNGISPENGSAYLKNAFDKYYLKTSALRGDGRGILLTYQLTRNGSPRF